MVIRYIVFTLSIGTPYLLTILVLNFELAHLLPLDVPAASDLSLHCLQRHICPNTKSYFGTLVQKYHYPNLLAYLLLWTVSYINN